MPDFEPGDIVKVPFPYTNRPTRQNRPALVVASLAEPNLLWVVMITSAENRAWADDVAIVDHAAVGLPAPSVIRPAKIATLDPRDAERIAVLPKAIFGLLQDRLKQTLGI